MEARHYLQHRDDQRSGAREVDVQRPTGVFVAGCGLVFGDQSEA